MVFVYAQAIEARLLSEFEFVQVIVINGVPFFGVIQFARHVDPHATVLLLEIVPADTGRA